MDQARLEAFLEREPRASVADRCLQLIDELLRHSQASAVGLMAISPLDNSHRTLFSVEYAPETLDHHTTTRYTRHCAGLQQILRNPDEVQCWDDIPKFRESFEAQVVYQPAGFQNGTSLVLTSASHQNIGLVHVSVRDEKFDSDTKHALEASRPLFANWVTTLARFAFARLTPRETEVLSLMRDGLSNAEIADGLVLAPRTITTHVESILRKLEARNRTQAAVLAERFGL